MLDGMNISLQKILRIFAHANKSLLHNSIDVLFRKIGFSLYVSLENHYYFNIHIFVDKETKIT